MLARAAAARWAGVGFPGVMRLELPVLLPTEGLTVGAPWQAVSTRPAASIVRVRFMRSHRQCAISALPPLLPDAPQCDRSHAPPAAHRPRRCHLHACAVSWR